ncbi:alpha-galactosidase [Salegentibacter salegens]|uniref:Melibiase n=1 Tax=Salegentibacter salegens TaxID=143223 RepID=A0A1M7IIT1_9FLAO|nr:alpha-galactosidase [Salegentibacter salegens]PRX40400.1 melibiase [Salegentibacter salegens]SHM40565.1 Melibiase [Salegentibacter salegens]
MKTLWFSILMYFLFFDNPIFSQNGIETCEAFLEGNMLVLSNNHIERKWMWNKGDIIPFSLTNIKKDKTLLFKDSPPAVHHGGMAFLKNEDFQIIKIEDDIIGGLPGHLQVIIINRYRAGVDVKKVFTIFPDTPAISIDHYLKYSVLPNAVKADKKGATGIEERNDRKIEGSFLDYYALDQKHWSMKFVEFRDRTDENNNLVDENEIIPYFEEKNYKGNLLLAHNLVNDFNFFILKEAPNYISQVNYPGYDFTVSNSKISIPFSGFMSVNADHEWVKGYTITIGVGGNEEDNLFALRKYLNNSIIYEPDTYEMIMMNTWGDRGQDSKINESFILKELEHAKRLGITHFQIDDGWQEGLSKNSSIQSDGLWGEWSPEHWKPNKERFPNGFKKILISAEEKDIRLGLWFHPSNVNDYKTWKTDANILVKIYESTGINYFKIDGIKIPNKKAEINLTNFFKEVKKATNGKVFFNLDLTADTRGGYFMFRDAGNLFLENRYTDFGNYFPFQTLRNLWMLSKYFPPQLLQVEFLNKWRNMKRYDPNDPFAPGNYDFDYLFATTIMGQPLAWMEASNLPEEAFESAPFIKKYKSLMVDIHQGLIMPLGKMPDGRSWTGFQAIQDETGYLLVFRENSNKEREELEMFIPDGSKVEFDIIYSNAQEYDIEMSESGEADVFLSKINSFMLCKYQIKK